MIVILAFCSGTVLSFDQPTRSSLIPVLVPKQDLMNAISLQSVVFNGSAVLGPALAGIAIGLLAYAGHAFGLAGSLTGYAGNFFLNGVSYAGVLIVLYIIRVPKDAAEQSTEKRGPMLASIRAALLRPFFNAHTADLCDTDSASQPFSIGPAIFCLGSRDINRRIGYSLAWGF